MTNQYWVHSLNPILFKLWILPIRWYGLMYILGFICGLAILNYRLKKGFLNLKSYDDVQDMVFYTFFGGLIGGRLGACFLYEPVYYLHHLWEIIAVWNGGMSSHGGFTGAIVGLFLYSKKKKVDFVHLLDNCAIAVTPGLFFGRIGNFINGELWGKVTHVKWAVIFPNVDMLPRHPVQIYQAICEGIIPLIVLIFFARKKQPKGLLSAIFAIVYSVLRIFTEHFREENNVLESIHLFNLTNGQIYSILFLFVGIGFLFYAYKHKPVNIE